VLFWFFRCYWYRGRAYFENLLTIEVPKACRPCWRYKQFLQVWQIGSCPTYRRPVRFWWQSDADLTKYVRPFAVSRGPYARQPVPDVLNAKYDRFFWGLGNAQRVECCTM
jgi:hypothetical protein